MGKHSSKYIRVIKVDPPLGLIFLNSRILTSEGTFISYDDLGKYKIDRKGRLKKERRIEREESERCKREDKKKNDKLDRKMRVNKHKEKFMNEHRNGKRI